MLDDTTSTWKLILFLWLFPLTLGIVALTRMALGKPPVKREEWRIFFGKSRQTALSFWMGLKFAALAISFFIFGLIQSVIIPNFGALWLGVPLLTGGAIIVLLALWLRSGNPKTKRVSRTTISSRPRESRIADTF